MARRQFRRLHGNTVGKLATAIWRCNGCGLWHPKQPSQCRDCGRMDFTYFPSRAEAQKYAELLLEVAVGNIVDLEIQPRFPLHVQPPDDAKPIKIGEYRADFRYSRGNRVVVVDVKGGADTHMSSWKRKHCEAQYGIEISTAQR